MGRRDMGQSQGEAVVRAVERKPVKAMAGDTNRNRVKAMARVMPQDRAAIMQSARTRIRIRDRSTGQIMAVTMGTTPCRRASPTGYRNLRRRGSSGCRKQGPTSALAGEVLCLTGSFLLLAGRIRPHRMRTLRIRRTFESPRRASGW